MTKTSVISTEYRKLQEQIYALYDKWEEILAEKTIIRDRSTANSYPLLPHMNLQIDTNDYHSFLQDLFAVLLENKSELNVDISHLKTLLDDDIMNQWVMEAITINSFYFSNFAQQNNLPDWLPLFAAEHAIRPFLHKVSSELHMDLPKQGHTGDCPVCGEQPRLGFINKEGKKEIICPRCHFSWIVKKISCAHCGTEEKGHVLVLKVEEDESAEVYACKDCKGYTKVIDTRKMFQSFGPEIMDLQTIHLDYIAQENGYGIPEEKDTH